MLLLNECSGNKDLAYQFSDADGLRTGRSGYSYGVSQFDIENNTEAILTLFDCGFTPKELKRLFLQNSNIDDLNLKLEASRDYVDEADNVHITAMIKHCCIFNAIEDCATLAMIIDYHNQLRFDHNGKLHRYLNGFIREGRPIDANTIYQFKVNHTNWGQKRPDDVKRRYENIMEVFNGYQ